MAELHNDAFKKEATSEDAVVAGTDPVDAEFSPAAINPTADRREKS